MFEEDFDIIAALKGIGCVAEQLIHPAYGG
jgi:hypothetical protein